MAGSGSSRGSGGKKKARIEIIPLIDVIFFLLATFILFMLTLNKSNGLPVHLPSVQMNAPRDPSRSVTVSVTDAGSIAWDSESINLDEFINRIQAYYKVYGPDGRILINADENAKFHYVFAYVLNQIRIAGFKKVLFETKTRAASR